MTIICIWMNIMISMTQKKTMTQKKILITSGWRINMNPSQELSIL